MDPDIDATVKPIYGRQEGAERGHNPPKPGRHGLPGLWSLLEALPRMHWPTLVGEIAGTATRSY